MENQLTAEQLAAYKIMKSGKDVFLSGYAGTGKSFLINKFIKDMREAGKNVVTAAPTGIAAINIGGTTLHRLLHLKADTNLTEEAEKYHYNVELINTDILIIDEISMCRSDLFKYTIGAITEANAYRFSKYVPPIQLIVVGDFCQLPPVVATKAEKEYFAGGKEFAFMTGAWEHRLFTNIFLKHVIRQKNKAFTQALNQTRLGNIAGLDYINTHSSEKTLPNAVTLCGTNKTAEDINSKRLSKIKGKSVTFEAEIQGHVMRSERPNSDYVTLKKGALVVFLTNEVNDLYQNGTIGTVEDFIHDIDNEEEITGVIVKLENGSTVNVAPHTWKTYNYEIADKDSDNMIKHLKKTEIGSFTQIPLKLAYAITIHKSQGQTYDAVNFDPEIWASGQLYVALSRVKDVSKLYLEKLLVPSMVILDNHVRDFYFWIESSQPKELEIAAESSSQHEKDKKKTPSKRGGRRKGSGRKKSVPGMESSPVRIPKILVEPLKEIKSLGADDVTEVAKMLQDFVQNHTKDNQ